MSLDLTPEIEDVVRERAAAEGVSVNDLLARTFAMNRSPLPPATDPREHVRAVLAEWRTTDNTPFSPPIPKRNGETTSEALFRKWEEEDANTTDRERDEEAEFWRVFQQAIDDERTTGSMRKLFR